MIDPTTMPLWPTLVRNTDPETSRAAAMAIVPRLPDLERFVCECVRTSPWNTANELAKAYQQNDTRRIGRRLSKLAARGVIRRGPARRCAVSGRMGQTWGPV